MRVCLSCGERFTAEGWDCPSCHAYPETVDGFLSFAPDLLDPDGYYNPAAFERLFRIENNHFWFRSRSRLLLWALERYFPRAESFFEIGCGTGYILSGIQEKFPHLRVYGSDIFSRGLSFAQRRLPDAVLFQMDARRIPFEEEFDVVGAFDVLEHINEDDVVLRQMLQAIKPGGGVIITVPQHPFLWSIVDERSCHKRRYIRADLVTKVKNAGFRIVRTTSFVSFLLPLILISRIRRERSRKEFDPSAETRVGGLTNAVLERVMTLERACIRQGVSLPAGGSLLIIAHRNRR